MPRQHLLLCAMLLPAAVYAQTLRTPVSFTQPHLTAYSHQFTDAFSFAGNLGALARQNAFSAGLFTEERFMLKDLRTFCGALVLPTASGNFGWIGNYSGSTRYNESMVGLGYGRKMGSKVSLGVQFNYYSLKAAGYGRAGAVGFDAGALFQIQPQLTIGVQASNPIGASWDKEGAERIPAIYKAGLGYDVSSQVLIGLEAEKVEDQPMGINAGLHYLISEKILTRTGIRSAANLYYLGFGVVIKRFRVDVTVSIHSSLGTTPGMLLLYSSKE